MSAARSGQRQSPATRRHRHFNSPVACYNHTVSIDKPRSQEAQREFPIWKTITLRRYKDGRAYVDAIKKAGMGLDEKGDALAILQSPGFASSSDETTVDVVALTPTDLGFNQGTEHEQIYKRAATLGLQLCTPEVGPSLRLAYADQPREEALFIAMPPVAVGDHFLGVFCLFNGLDGKRLSVDVGQPPGIYWNQNDRIVFTRPKSS
jgi:hypothetical protein